MSETHTRTDVVELVNANRMPSIRVYYLLIECTVKLNSGKTIDICLHSDGVSQVFLSLGNRFV